MKEDKDMKENNIEEEGFHIKISKISMDNNLACIGS